MAELTIQAHVFSAVALGEEKISTLRDTLSKKLGKPVEIMPGIDPSLIGGLYIHVGGFVIDHSVKRQLADLKDSLKRRNAL